LKLTSKIQIEDEMKILMTISTGFIGKCFVRVLEDLGCKIWYLMLNVKDLRMHFSGLL